MAAVVASTSAASNATSFNVARPTGTADGHVMVATLSFDSGTYAAATLPTGFRLIFGHNRGDAANGIKFKVGVKIAASEPANYSFGQGGGSDGVGTVTAVSGAQLAFIWSLDTRANATALIAPSVARYSASDVLLCGAAQDGSGAGITWTPPAGMTEEADANSGGFTTSSVASLAAPANPSGSKSFTASASGAGGAITWSLVVADSGATISGIRPVVEAGEVQDIAAATSTAVPMPHAGSIATGNYLIARLALDNSGASGAATTLSVSDPRSNSWTVTAAANRTAASAANDGATCYIAYAKVTNAYTNGDSITFNYGNSTTANAIVIEEWAGIDGTTPLAVAATTATGSSTTPSVARTPTAAGQLFYGALAVEGPEGDAFTQDADTTDGVWSGLPRVASISGTAASNQCVVGGWKVVTGTSAQTWDPTLGTSRDWAQLALVFAAASTGTTASATEATATASVQDATTAVAGSAQEAPVAASAQNAAGLTAVVAVATEAPATGVGQDATTTVAASSQAASATASALDSSSAVASAAQEATATAAAQDAAVLTSVVAVAVEASVGATAETPTGLVSSSAQPATATAAAQDATTTVVVTASEATATAAAQDATALTGSSATASPTEATATATAQDPAVSVATSATEASGTETALDPGVAVIPTAVEATATASAQLATTSVASSPIEAPATATAIDPTGAVAATATAATAAATALDPTGMVLAAAGEASASATAHDAAALTGSVTTAPASEAAATALALDPTTAVAASAGASTAAAEAFDATASTSSGTTAMAAVASATAAGLDATARVVAQALEALADVTANDATVVVIEDDLPDGGVVLRVKEITAQAESYVKALGVVESVNGGELRHMIGRGLRAALWFERIEPVPEVSGLEFVTVRLEMKIRIFGNVQEEPSDQVEPEMLEAVDAVMNAFATGYTLEGEVRDVDLYGAHGQRFSAQAGYLDLQEGTCRVETITVPFMVNDVWQLVA